MAENVDEKLVDEIIKTAEADSPESRLEKLEKEVDTIKGAIKRLLLDIRETLNNLENPFQNLQSLADGLIAAQSFKQPPPPQQVQIIPPPPEQPTTQEEEVAEEEKKEEEQKEFGETQAPHAHLESGLEKIPGGEVVEKSAVQQKTGDEVMGLEKLSGVEETETLRRMGIDIKMLKYDIETLFEIMGWVRGMLEKYSADSLKLMLEIFKSAGYIKEESVQFVSQIADLLVMNDNFEEMIFEFYRLYKLLNPEDTSMDSKLLNLIIDRKLVI